VTLTLSLSLEGRGGRGLETKNEVIAVCYEEDSPQTQSTMSSEFFFMKNFTLRSRCLRGEISENPHPALSLEGRG
jgi:hypothetical protein